MSTYRRTAHLKRIHSAKNSQANALPVDPFDLDDISWSNIESKFSALMSERNTLTVGVSTLGSRPEHCRQVSAHISELLNRALEECRCLLADGDGEAAEEAGMKVLRMREAFHGSNHPELIPVYIHLARTKQFLEFYGAAEDMLSLANFILLQNQDHVSTNIKAELHQTFGLLYAADRQLDTAVQHLTCAAYYLSCLYGPKHPLTAFSYFDLGNVFVSKASMEGAMALYDGVKDIWYTFLKDTLEEVIRTHEVSKQEQQKGGTSEIATKSIGRASAVGFGIENLADASKMLHGIFHIQQKHFRVAHPATARAEFVLGLFLLWIEDNSAAMDHMESSRNNTAHFYGVKHPFVQEIEWWCTQLARPLNACPVDHKGLAEARGEDDNTKVSSNEKVSM